METEIRVWYTLTGLDLDPSEITALTNLQPSKVWRRGDVIDPRRPARHYKRSGWRIASGCGDKVDLETQVVALLNRLSPVWPVVADLGTRFDAEIECVMYMYGGDRPSEHFDRKVLKRIDELNASIDVDLYNLPARSDGI